MGDNEMAIHHYRQELLIEMLHSKNNYSPNVMVTLVNLAEIYKEKEDYDYALILYRHIAQIQEVVLGKYHLDVSITLSNIGFVLYQKEKFNDALIMYQRALKIRSETLSSTALQLDLDYASILTQLGLALIQIKKWSLALEALTHSICIRQCDDEETSLTLCTIGMIYDHFGDDKKALHYFEKALGIERRVVGCEHENVARILLRIGRIYKNIGDDHLDDALNHLNVALCIQKKNVNDKNDTKLSIARTLNCIGNVYLQKGDADKAMQTFIEASRICREVGVSDETLMVVSSNSIAFGQFYHDAPAA